MEGAPGKERLLPLFGAVLCPEPATVSLRPAGGRPGSGKWLWNKSIWATPCLVLATGSTHSFLLPQVLETSPEVPPLPVPAFLLSPMSPWAKAHLRRSWQNKVRECQGQKRPEKSEACIPLPFHPHLPFYRGEAEAGYEEGLAQDHKPGPSPPLGTISPASWLFSLL